MFKKFGSSVPFRGRSLVGERFGRLVVVGFLGVKITARSQRALWDCLCDEGNRKAVSGNDLKRGLVKSCGCLHRDRVAGLKWRHGYATAGHNHPLYSIWSGMNQRCSNPKATSYRWYGSKGIQVCSRWRDFVNFKNDMGPSWLPGLEIDRISSDGNYSPENCKWSGHHDQTRNHKRHVWFELNGIRKVASDWAEDLGANHRIIHQRLRLGWSLEKALTQPVRKVTPYSEYVP